MEPMTRDYYGTTIYCCPLCAFDTESRERIDEHIAWRHRKDEAPVVEAVKPQRRRVSPEIVADTDRVITLSEPIEEEV